MVGGGWVSGWVVVGGRSCWSSVVVGDGGWGVVSLCVSLRVSVCFVGVYCLLSL